MSILVTGATGLVGSHLCQRLVSEDCKVIGLIHNRANKLISSLSDCENFEVCVGDVLDSQTLYEIIKRYKVKTIFHLAAHMPYTPNNDLININIKGALNMLNGAYLNNVEEFIYASSMGIYSDPPMYLPVDESHPMQPSNTYGATKLASEFACRSYQNSMTITILRYAGIYGTGMDSSRAIAKFVRYALNNQPITIFSKGGQSNDFAYIDDIIEGTYLAWSKKKSGTYNIGSGQEAFIISLARKIIELAGSKSHIVFSNEESNRPFRFVLDITKARNNLGYLPHSLEEGLKLYTEDVKREEYEQQRVSY